MKIRILICIFVFVALSISAQMKISGKIIDGKNEDVIEFSKVVLMKIDSTFVQGVLSDSKGTFTIPNIEKGKYILSLASIGYETKFHDIPQLENNLDLGKIKLENSDVILKEATVTAHTMIQKVDRKIILPTENQIKTSNSGVSLLQNLQLPRIIIDPINNAIKSTGEGNVQLRVNGVEVSQAEIATLQPTDIVRIEYHDEPGLRYGSAVAVIDFIVRRRESGGSISTNLMNAISDVGFAEDYISAKINHKKSEFAVNAYWRYRDVDWTRQNEDIFNFPSSSLVRTEKGQPTKFKQNNFRLALNYSLSQTDNYLLNVAFRNNRESLPNNYTDRISTISSSDGTNPISVVDHSTWKSNVPSLDLYFQKKMINNQLVIFNVVGTYIDSKSTRLYSEKGDKEFESYSHILGDKYSVIGEGIYEKTIGKYKISTGLKHNQSRTENNYSGDVSRNIHLDFAETYSYVELQSQKNKLNYMFGIGAMRTYNKESGKDNEQYIFRPTVRLSYKINDKASVRYNAFISGRSPSLSDLNNITQRIDSFQIRRGNPNLKSVWFYTNSLSADFRNGIMSVELYSNYTYNHKPIMEQKTFENDMFITTNANQKAFHRTNVEATFRLKPYKDHITLSLTPGVRHFLSVGNDYEHSKTNAFFRGSLSGNYKNWVLYFEMYTRRGGLWGEVYESGESWHSIMAGYNKQKWSMKAGVMLPFVKTYSLQSYNYSKLMPNYSYVSTNNLSQMIFVNFTYTINFGRVFKGNGKRLNNDDSDAGIMKGTK